METITIGLAGDVMIGRLVNDYLATAASNSIWGNMLSYLHNTDFNLINLEAALTKSTRKVPKVFNFKAHPKTVQTLVDGKINLVNLANNHVLDYSEAGLIETLETLDKAHILHVGAGKDAAEASASVIVNRKGVRIGILGCTDNEPDWIAGPNTPGTRYLKIGDLDAIRDDIVHLRSQVHILILSIHWGPNMRERSSKHFIQFAHDMVDCGVDIFHGHSAHIFQGVEIYKQKLILYDTGDFIDDYAVDPLMRNDRSFFFIVEVDKQKIKSLRLIPTLIENFQVNQATGREAEEAIQRMEQLSNEFQTHFEKAENSLFIGL